MTVHLATYYTPEYSRAAQLCYDSARANGVDAAWATTREQMRKTAVYRNNKALFDQPRGAGYFAWKPFSVLACFDHIANENLIVYADAGVKFIDNVSHIIDRMDQDIFLFGNEWEHYQWCKRDIIEAIMPGSPWEAFGKQGQASVIFFRVNDYTRAFVKEWLDWCLFEGGRLVDDSPSRTPNHPEFRENRYDQAILTTMAYRDGIRLHGWFVRYPTFEPARVGYEDDMDMPTMFMHHRWRDSEWQEGVLA